MGLLGRDPIPVAKRDEVASLTAEFEGLRTADTTRLNRYAEYRRENEAARELDLVSRVTGGDYGRRGDREDSPPRHYIPLPFGQALTVKHSYRIAGRLPDAIVDRREESAEERYRSDTMEKIWWGIVRASGEDVLFSSGAHDGSQLGATVYEACFDAPSQVPLIRSIDPAGFLAVRGLDDPHNFQRIYRFWQTPVETARAEYRNVEFCAGVSVEVSELESTHKVGEIPMVMIVEMVDKERSVRFAPQNGDRSVPLMERRHGLGFVPFVVIPNIGPYRDIWGWADYEFVRALVHYLPQLLSREADILRMVANGAFIEKGTGQDPSTVKRTVAAGGILPSKRDGSVEPIEAPETPAFQVNHADRAVEFLKMLGFAPDASWGGSDTRSGSDRALQLQPLLELTAMKQMNWSAGLSRLAAFCFRMIEEKQITTSTYRGSRPQGVHRSAFAPFQLGPGLGPIEQEVDGEFGSELILLPRTPKELFQGDYAMRFRWQNRIDPDDPSYVLSELNKFQQGAQSLRRTLENLGIENPEDEMKLIEEEAERFPWLRQGMIALLRAELANVKANEATGAGQGAGGGAPEDPLASLFAGLEMTGTKDGSALDTDAQGAALSGSQKPLYGGA